MARNQPFTAALRIHKRWADPFSLVSIVLVVGLLGVTATLADYANADLATRIGMLMIMAAVIIVVCVWQAAAFVAAAIQNLITEQGGGTRSKEERMSSSTDRGPLAG